MVLEVPRFRLMASLVVALVLAACGSSGDSGRGAGGLIGQNPGGGTSTPTELDLQIVTEDVNGDPISSGGLNMRPGERRRFTATLTNPRTVSRRPVPGVTINFAFVDQAVAEGTAFITIPTASGACPSPGQFSERRGGVTDDNGEVEFCVVAPSASAFEGQSDDTPLTLSATAFTEDNDGESVRTVALYDLFIVFFVDNYLLELTGPGGQVSESLTLDAGDTLNGFVAQLRSETGDPIPSGTFIRLTNDTSIGRVITPQSSGGTVGSNGRLSFGYEAGCPAVGDLERVTLLGNANVNGANVESTYDLFVRRPPATATLQLPSGTTSVLSGDTLQDIQFNVVRDDRASLSGVVAEVSARLNGSAVGEFVDTRTGNRGNPLLLTLPASGNGLFDYEAPSGLVNNQRITLTAEVDDDARCLDLSAPPRTLQVNAIGAPVLTVLGLGGEESNTLEIEQGTTEGFRILAEDGIGRPLSGIDIRLSRTPAVGAGRIVIPGTTGSRATTNFEGLVTFNYEAPPTVAAETVVTVTATATIDGANVVQTYVLTLLPPPPPPPPVINLIGPSTAAPGAETRGFRATLNELTGAAIEDAEVTLTASNGTVSIIENGVLRPGLTTGTTDALGRLEFAFTPASNVTDDATASITARLTDDVFDEACFADASAVCARTVSVTVQADDFRFTAPVFGTSVTVGAPNAQTLALRWRTAAGQPVVNPNGGAPCVDLSTTFTGSGNAVFGLVISDDPTPQSQRRRVQLDSAGNFAQSVAVFSDRSGFLEIQARENRNCGPATTGNLLATTGVQFIDEPCERSADGRDCVDLSLPLVLVVDPDSTVQPSVELVMDVRNSAFQPIDGAQVLFRITNAASGGGTQPTDPNERVFPGGGTTDTNGIARSRYFAPNVLVETTVDIEGCVRAAGSGDIDGRFCRTRRLTLRPPTP